MNSRLKFALVGAVVGAIIGSTLGVAGSFLGLFFGAISGTGIFAVIGFVIAGLAEPDIKKHQPKVRKLKLASFGLVGAILKPILGLLNRK